MTLQKGKGVVNRVDKTDKRKANIHLTEIMIAAQEMMERAETRRDVKIAEAIYWCAMALEFLMKAPPEEQERKW